MKAMPKLLLLLKKAKRAIRIALRPIDEIVEGDLVKLNPILFDFDKHNIKPQAAFELG